MVDIATLQSQAIQIRDESRLRANSAQRVGTALLNIINDLPDYIDPAAYGGVGNGTADDYGAIVLAIDAGIAAGKPVSAPGKTYAVSGNVVLPENAWLQDITIKQLSPAGSTRRTLTSAGGDNIRLVRVTVDRNGTGEYGQHQSSAGVYINGGSNHHFEDVEVFGDDIGGGFFLINATNCDLIGIWAHDIKYLLASDPGNDRVMGIYLNGCSNVRIDRCTAEDIGGDFGGGYTLRWSRGYGFSGCTDIQLLGCVARMVDQGYDATGGINNTRFQFTGCFAVDCFTWGFKFANTARDCQVTGCTAERCHLSGFVVNGPSGPVTGDNGSSDIDFVGCVAYDTGATGLPGTPVPGGKVGFRVMRGDPLYDSGTTLGIRFIACKARDRQAVPTTTYGFQNDVPVSTGLYNEVISSVSLGHTALAVASGMHASRCTVGLAAPRSIAADSWQDVPWDTDADHGAMHSTSSNAEVITNRRPGTYQLTGAVSFATSVATGVRGMRWKQDGVVVPGSTVLVPAAAGETSIVTSVTVELTSSVALILGVFQSSGASVNITTASTATVNQVG